ncbi:1-acyl-sn-glycerol-3-phosphate acyltransferase [Aliidiomarina minuta]|uniref:1-acyl-sn-glycerol-3-phosphate acyltransferase n=1 Tax=Aliidiomarina minuta TaxID=880057 RepID=A0A432W191_9GAMM|nr:1-acylglycerol-3-phosphate O-acyltransferase [Aliidiomarina minuta]RUO22991.1 1-acyl-sn-glycerol-3-phosphate acyltransferase [Aliidiomarina minuta]
MLAAVRLLILAILFILVGVFGCLFLILRPFHRNNTAIMAHAFGRMHRVIGLKLEIRVPPEVEKGGPFVFIANHQNSYDILTMSRSLLPGTVSIGKKSLKWVPFFGQVYWLAGNILIDRKNSGKAHGTISSAANAIKERQLSVWMFPEGTRSYGKRLLPFKTGAFHTALQADVPIVPVCMSSTHDQVKLNRWRNGTVILEMMAPISTEGLTKNDVRPLMQQCHEQMDAKIAELDAEVAARDKAIA